MSDRMLATLRQVEAETHLAAGTGLVSASIDDRAAVIYDAVFDGYNRAPWTSVTPMDRFRCERAVVALDALDEQRGAA